MIFVILIAAPIVGLLLIFLIARFSPNVPRDVHPLQAAVPEITPDEFQDLIRDLFEATELDVVFSAAGTGAVLDLTLRDRRPLTGGRIVVHASPVLQHGAVDAVDVLSFADSVRSESGTLKGIYIALAGFTNEAKSAVRSSLAVVELIEGPDALLRLVETSLGSERAEALGSYRGFRERPFGHRRAQAAPEPESD